MKKIRQKCLFYTIITSSDPRCATTHGYNQLNGWFLKKHKSSWAKETLLAINQSLNDNKERKCDFPIIIPPNDNNKGVPIHLFTTDIEEDALEQIRLLAESPLPTDYVSVMPDAHLGKGVTVGTVFASQDYVSPNAVGVDIGCGMAAVPIHDLYKWNLSRDDLLTIQKLIKERIPTGFNQHRKTLHGTKSILEQITQEVKPSTYLEQQLLLPRVTDQLGTLGGGNHFIEVLYDENDGQVWIMLHSGSRNIGNRVATHYDGLAKSLLRSKGIDVKALKGINYMPIDSQEGQNYLRDMEWCQQYAFYNREVMKSIMLDIIKQVMGGKEADTTKAVNIHHNYCSCEDCGGGRKLWVTRKGATSAKQGEAGIIPGSMGTGSYITRGKGNKLSWNSSSHGAGRRMSRTQAHNSIPQTEFEKVMDGIICDTHPSVKDEAPQAYKDLSVVMQNQISLTDITHRLLPIINVKGFEKKIPNRFKRKIK